MRQITDGTSRAHLIFQIIRDLYQTGITFSGDARFKAIWHRENFSHFLKGEDELVRPVTVEFWPSLSCNARCRFCPYRINKARQIADKNRVSNLTTLEIARKISTELAGFQVRSVLLTGGGEPFMNPDIDKIVKIFKEAGLAIGVYTNGTLPNCEQQIRNIIKLGPRFIRMSINAGSAAEHFREYHIKTELGLSSWDMVKRNALTFLAAIDEFKVDTTFGLSFVFFGNEPETSYIGMAKFIAEIHEVSKRLPLYVHFKPKFIYYRNDGMVTPDMPVEMAQGIVQIPQMIEKFVLPNLPHSNTLIIEINTQAIQHMAGKAKPQACFSTGWATSINHLGEGYILSELCGAKWEGAKWGNLLTQTMNEAWFSPERLRLQKEYATSNRKAPIHHKLTGIQSLLFKVRDIAGGSLTDIEINQFWCLFEHAYFPRPYSWDFI